MLRSVKLLDKGVARRALSALTGNSYPPSATAQLNALGFSSELWLTESQMAVFGVQVAPEHKGKGYALKTTAGNSFTLYNAAQTTDVKHVEKMKGCYAIYNALTGERIRGDAEEALRAYVGKFPTNEWLTDRDVDALSIQLQADAKPVIVNFEFEKTSIDREGTSNVETRSASVGYYNLGQVANAEVLLRARKVMPISVSTGQRYRGQAARVLLRSAVERGYTSPFWLTMQSAQALGLLIMNPDMIVTINVNENKVVNLYNACETNDPTKVASAAYNAKHAPRSGMSGAVYPAHTLVVLKNVALEKQYRSVYWLSAKQASVLGIEIRSGEQPTSIMTETGTVDLYNAEQTTGKSLVEARFGHRS